MPYSEKQIAEWADPTAADLADPLFEAIWQATKSWDVNVPKHYVGYCGMNGSHVMWILNALRPLIAAVRKETREECARVCEEWGYSQHDFGPPAEGKIFSGLTTFDNRDVPKQAAIAAAIRNLQEREEGKT